MGDNRAMTTDVEKHSPATARDDRHGLHLIDGT